jgi:hypothetical protein
LPVNERPWPGSTVSKSSCFNASIVCTHSVKKASPMYDVPFTIRSPVATMRSFGR